MSLHKKLSRSYVLLISTVSLIMLVGSFLAVSLVALPNIRISMQSKLSELENRINEQFSYLERAADSAFLNMNEVEYSSISGEKGSELLHYNTINSCLYMMRLVYTDVQWAFLLDGDGKAYADNVLIERALQSGFDDSFNAVLASGHGRTHVFGLQSIPSINGGAPVLLVGKDIHYVFNIKSIGYLYVAVDTTALDTLYKEEMLYDGQQIYICDQNETILSSTDVSSIGFVFDAKSGKNGSLVRYDGRTWLCQRQYVDSLDADIVMLIPAGELFKTNNLYILVLIIAFINGFIFAFFESSRITRSILAPLHRLSDAMNEVRSGNISVRCGEEEEDREIRLLAISFNHMLERIGQLIESVKQKQQEKASIELTLQQNKIQPHFLYNSLNTVSALCQMGQLNEASHAAQLIAQYYRAVLSGGRDIVTLGEELHNVELYLQIIRVSCSHSFHYRLICDNKSIFNCPIPKLTLQPFVENAVKHGFRGLEEDEISITVNEENRYISIVIEDNGIGAEEKVFADALDERNPEHFGIKSVGNRMQLLCGEDYSLTTQSRPGTGTKITLRYPALDLPADIGAER